MLGMALIKCPACNRKVSTDAVACPKCGDPLTEVVGVDKEKQKRDTRTRCFLIALAAVCAMVFFNDQDSLKRVSSPRIEVSKLYAVTASTLNQRRCASSNCEIVGILKKGTIVRAQDVQGSWVRISDEHWDDNAQWVSAQYLEEDTSNPTSMLPRNSDAEKDRMRDVLNLNVAKPLTAEEQVRVDAVVDQLSKNPKATTSATSRAAALAPQTAALSTAAKAIKALDGFALPTDHCGSITQTKFFNLYDYARINLAQDHQRGLQRCADEWFNKANTRLQSIVEKDLGGSYTFDNTGQNYSASKTCNCIDIVDRLVSKINATSDRHQDSVDNMDVWIGDLFEFQRANDRRRNHFRALEWQKMFGN
jgi:hypothetical protein